jgi:hypothetical protein
MRLRHGVPALAANEVSMPDETLLSAMLQNENVGFLGYRRPSCPQVPAAGLGYF